MNELVEKLKPIVDETVDKLGTATFKTDPIAGSLFSRIVSVLSSSYKRHGNILEAAILHRVDAMDRYEAHRVDRFFYTNQASTIVDTARDDLASLDDTHLPYDPTETLSRIQLDMVVFDRETRIVSSYEIKRGNGAHDAGKKRAMRREALISKVLLKSYGEQYGWDPVGSTAHVIFYYNERGLPAPLGITGDELDAHFDAEIIQDIEAVNTYFRSRLFEILSQ